MELERQYVVNVGMIIVLLGLEKNVNVLEAQSLPEKKEDARMECLNCGHDLICRKKSYGGKFADSLQWQNEDGTAHYKTKNGKDFDCVFPKDDEAQDGFTEETEPITSTGPLDPNVLVSDLDSITSKYVDDQITLIREIEKKVYFVLGVDARGDKVGMYVKLILEGINRK